MKQLILICFILLSSCSSLRQSEDVIKQKKLEDFPVGTDQHEVVAIIEPTNNFINIINSAFESEEGKFIGDEYLIEETGSYTPFLFCTTSVYCYYIFEGGQLIDIFVKKHWVCL